MEPKTKQPESSSSRLSDYVINSSRGISIGLVVLVVGAAFAFGRTFTEVGHSVKAVTESVSALSIQVVKLTGDMNNLSVRLQSKTCEDIKRSELADFARSLSNMNDGLRIPNPYNPRHVRFPGTLDCRGMFDRDSFE